MKKIAEQTLNLPRYAPVMVLPGAQLFPATLLPLYIFEPRYRAMLAWSLEKDRMFCIAPMKAGVSEAHTTDDFHHLVGLGIVRVCVGGDDGTSRLILLGIARVRLIGFVQDSPFRIAELQEADSLSAPPEKAGVLMEQLIKASGLFSAQGPRLPAPIEAELSRIEDPTILSDVIAQTFLKDPELRQEVFEELDTSRRTDLLIRYLRNQEADDDSHE